MSDFENRSKNDVPNDIAELMGGGGRALEVGGLWRWKDFGGGKAWEVGGLRGEVEGAGKGK